MTILEAVGNYLEDRGFGTLGTNIFLGILPETPDVCIGVFESAGVSPMFTMGTAGIEVDKPSIQLQVRSTRDDYPTARDNAENARRLLAEVANQTIEGIRILRIEPTGSVLPLGVDENHRPMISVNFRCFVEI
jgi:hypothetical protein